MGATRSQPRLSWICRDLAERERFLDLHRRLLAVNTKILVLVVVIMTLGAPTLAHPLALLPAGVGVAAFGAVQRRASTFARPELWVFTGLLGAQAMIVLALAVNGAADSPAVVLVVWPVAGMAGRFHDRALLVGTLYSALVVAGAEVVTAPSSIAGDPVNVLLAVTGILAVSVVCATLRDSDIDHRSAATLDALTGMLNRAALTRRIAEIEPQSRLSREPVGLVVVDLDRFKAINDTHGHGTGDAVLRSVAYLLRRELRAYDLAYRLGGEEFAILVPGAGLPVAAELAERLRAAVAETPLDGVAVTLSAGVAASPQGGEFSWAAVFESADAALYRAKAAGRNRVEVAPPAITPDASGDADVVEPALAV